MTAEIKEKIYDDKIIGSDISHGQDDDIGDGSNQDQAEDSSSTTVNKSASKEDLRSAEGKPKESDTEDGGDEMSDANTNWKTKSLNASKKVSKGKARLRKNFALFGAAGGGLAIMGLFLLFLFLSNAKIVHLAEQVTAYNMARSARTFRQSLSQNTAESIEAEAINDGRFAALKARFDESSVKTTIDKMNSYRPAKVLKQLESELEPSFKPGPPSRFLGKPTEVFEGWKYKGVLVEATDPKFTTPIANYKDKLRLSSELNAILEQDSRGISAPVRTRVINNFLESRGLGKLRWWDKAFIKKLGLNPEAADSLTQALSHEESKTPRGTCTIAATCDIADDVEKTVTEKLDDGTLAKASSETVNDTISEEATKTIRAGISSTIEGTITKTLSITSNLYGIAMPLCLIFDGSIESSKVSTDNTENTLMKNFFMIRTAADEIKKGGTATSATAIKGLSNKIGDIGNSVPQRRAAGEVVDSAKEVNASALPQSSSTGTFSILNVLFDGVVPGSIIDASTAGLQKACPVVTNVWTGVGLTVVEAAVAFFSGGGSKEGGEAAGIAFKTFTARTLSKAGVKIVVAEGATKSAERIAVAKAGGLLFKKIVFQVAATVGLTELAHMAVLKHMNSGNIGLSTGETLANQADMGGNLYAQGVNRTFLYGKPLEQLDVADSKLADASYLNDVAKRRSINDRYFAISNPSSFLSRMGTSLSMNLSKSGIKLGSRLTGLLAGIQLAPRSIVASIVSKTAHAAPLVSGAGDYNIVQWGWTKEETNRIDTNPDYSPLENELILKQSGKEDQIKEAYEKCYTKTDGELFADKDIQRAPEGEVYIDKGDCSPNNLGLRNSTFGDLVMRWRLKMRNDNVRDHLTEIQNAQ
ncbi:MAG: hypothetical protein WCO19_02905 [Candidatus Saccharibacteria bacterium]